MKVLIVGAGKLGQRVSEALLAGDYDVTIIDKKQRVIDKLSSHIDGLLIQGDGKEISLLKQLNIGSFDYLLTTTDSDETNIVIASFAKKLGCKNVIARVRDPEHMNQFDFIKETMGIDYLVNPDLSITLEIYKYLAEKYTLSNGIFTSGKISLIEFPATSFPKVIGVKMTNISEMLENMLVVAISRNGKLIIPHGAATIEDSDLLYVIGEKTSISNLNSKISRKGRKTSLQKVMIIGGGKTGYYLAKKLSEFGARVKIVEKDKTRCQYLSTNLENVMVLNIDGTDIAALEEENLNEMDAFVTATGYDEENLLLALTAKQHNIPDVISKVSHESYINLIGKMGVDMVLNPLDITASNILKNIKGSKKVISSLLIQGQAEIMEIHATSDMNFVNIPLSDLTLPEGVLIGAIYRGSDVIIPKGINMIKPNDRVIILSLLSELEDVEKLFKAKGTLIK